MNQKFVVSTGVTNELLDVLYHLASYPIGTGCSFPRGKAVGACSWPPTST